MFQMSYNIESKNKKTEKKNKSKNRSYIALDPLPSI